MSEQGWREFLKADGVGDWVVLHGGATAAFRVGSVQEAAQLAEAVAGAPGFAGSGAVLTIVDDRLTVRLTRDLWQLEALHVDLARAVSEVARERGALADRASVQEVQLAISAKPRRGRSRLLARRAGLWADGRRQRGRSTRTWLDGLDAGARRGQAAPTRDAR